MWKWASKQPSVPKAETWTTTNDEIYSWNFVGLDELNGTLYLLFMPKNGITTQRISIPATALITTEKGMNWLRTIEKLMEGKNNA